MPQKDYPSLLYGNRGEVKEVNNGGEYDSAIAAGLRADPYPHFDYSRISNGVAERFPSNQSSDPETKAPESETKPAADETPAADAPLADESAPKPSE